MRLPVIGWVLAALFLGILVGERLPRGSPTLCERLDALGVLRGRDYATIRDTAGCAPCADLPRENGEHTAVWEGDGYRISVRFDAEGMCLGVEEETERPPGRKKIKF